MGDSHDIGASFIIHDHLIDRNKEDSELSRFGVDDTAWGRMGGHLVLARRGNSVVRSLQVIIARLSVLVRRYLGTREHIIVLTF